MVVFLSLLPNEHLREIGCSPNQSFLMFIPLRREIVCVILRIMKKVVKHSRISFTKKFDHMYLHKVQEKL